jgi:phosphoglycerate kinase
MTAFRTLDDIGDVRGKRILVRVDLNVPMEAGRVTDDTRLKAVLPTIRELADKGARVILLAHFGRPKGRRDPAHSLRPVTAALADLLGRPVAFAEDCIGPDAESAIAGLPEGGVLLLENTRYHPGEETNEPEFVAALARLGEIYVNDAFSAAHRAHASTEGLAHRLPAYAGRSMQAELEALRRALGEPVHPVVAVIGGAKVSTKIDLLENLVKKVDALVIGGGMANTFLAAEGKPIGKSLHEPDLLEKARQIRAAADAAGCAIVLPVDAVVAAEFKANAPSRTVPVAEVGADDMILDVGRITIEIAKEKITEAKTLVWNGPVGAFEVPPFERATVALAKCAAERTRTGDLLSVAGGGDTVAALNQAAVTEEFSYVSTAGGAFLEWLEGKTLPGVEALSAGQPNP